MKGTAFWLSQESSGHTLMGCCHSPGWHNLCISESVDRHWENDGFLKSLGQTLSFLEVWAQYRIHITLCSILSTNMLLMNIFRSWQWVVTTSSVYYECFHHYVCLHNYLSEKLWKEALEPVKGYTILKLNSNFKIWKLKHSNFLIPIIIIKF